MSESNQSSSSREKVRAHRERLRRQGLRPIQIWVPDVRSRAFKSEAHRQSQAVAQSPHAQEDQDFIDSISEPGDAWKRGEIWTVSGGPDYAGKPRPAVIVQDDSFDATASITICAFTTDPTEAPLFRLLIEPSDRNGLQAPSRLMVDKITTVRKEKLGLRIGRLDDEDVVRLNQTIVVFLGLAASPRSKRSNDWDVDLIADLANALEITCGHSKRDAEGAAVAIDGRCPLLQQADRFISSLSGGAR